MSLMNCMFTVRWSDENNKPHSKTYANEADARKAKQWLLERGVRDIDIVVRINNKPAGGLQNDEKKSESTAEQKGFWWQE